MALGSTIPSTTPTKVPKRTTPKPAPAPVPDGTPNSNGVIISDINPATAPPQPTTLDPSKAPWDQGGYNPAVDRTGTTGTVQGQLSYQQQMAAQIAAGNYGAYLNAQQARNSNAAATNSQLAIAGTQWNNRALQDSTNASLASNRESMYRNQLDQQQSANDDAFTRRRWSLVNDQYALDQAFITETWGLANQDLAADNAHIQAQQGFNNAQYMETYGNRVAQSEQLQRGYGFADRMFQQANAGIDLQRDTNNQALMSETAAKGSQLSQGFGDNLSNITRQTQLGRDKAQLAKDQTFDSISGDIRDLFSQMRNTRTGNESDNESFGYQLDQRGQAYKSEIAGLKKQQSDTGVAYQSQIASLQRELDSNTLAGSALQSMAREYGIREQDLLTSFRNGVQRNNLDMNRVIAQINQDLTSGNAQLAAQATQMMAQIVGA